jgi:hypothetical protein
MGFLEKSVHGKMGDFPDPLGVRTMFSSTLDRFPVGPFLHAGHEHGRQQGFTHPRIGSGDKKLFMR